MGKKRKQEKSEEEIRRKIKKLTEKLAKTSNTSIGALSPNDFNPTPLDMPYSESPYCDSVPDTYRYEESSLPVSPMSVSPRMEAEYLTSPLPQSVSINPEPNLPTQPGPSSSADQVPTDLEEVELGEDILQLFGNAPKEDSSMGPAIHKDIATRWQDILAKGLSKDVKENIYKDYLVPSNCDLLVAPILNPEVKVALPVALVKRDSSLMNRQKQLSLALSALANLTDKIISGETSKQRLLKPLSDACRILCDSHYLETKTRRDFVISSTNVKLKDTLIETTRDKFLFGENVSEKLKIAKTIQQSGNVLKVPSRVTFQPSASTSSTKGRLNYVVQHRKVERKPNDLRRTSSSAQRPSQNSNARRPRERPLPAKPRSANRR